MQVLFLVLTDSLICRKFVLKLKTAMDIFIAQPNTIEQATALKAVMEALKIDYEVKTEKSPYDNRQEQVKRLK